MEVWSRFVFALQLFGWLFCWISRSSSGARCTCLKILDYWKRIAIYSWIISLGCQEIQEPWTWDLLFTLPETNSQFAPWKWMVGRRLFPFGVTGFLAGANSFREGNLQQVRSWIGWRIRFNLVHHFVYSPGNLANMKGIITWHIPKTHQISPTSWKSLQNRWLSFNLKRVMFK